MIHSAIITVMLKAAQKAAKAMLRDFGEVDKLQVSRKGTMDFVTQTDIRSEKILREELNAARPKYGFLLEEGGEIAGDGEHRWVVDPLDGTTNFIHAVPYLCIALSLEKRVKDGSWQTIAALVYDPLRDEAFHAEQHKGAFLGNRRIQVSARQKFDEALLVTHSLKYDSIYYERSLKIFTTVAGQSKGIRMMGATALDLAYIAAGRYDGAWYSFFKPWDISAGKLLVQEAGGVITRIDGSKDLSAPESLLAATPKIHAALLKVVSSLWVG